MQDYITIKQNIENTVIISKSRFITYLFKVTDEEEAKNKIAEIKMKHKDANHNCSAYTIGDQHQIQKANDDGEPSGTAGVPMLEALKKNEVHNTVAVVTRYFGGIKLGTGGLIRAYQGGVSEAIHKAGKVIIRNGMAYAVTLPYDLTGKFDYQLQNTHYELKDQTYTDKVTYHIHIRSDERETFESFVTNTTDGKAVMEVVNEMMLPFTLEEDS